MGTLRVSFLSALVLELLATLSVAVVAVGIGLRVVEGEMTLFTGLFVLILAPEVYLPLRQVGVHYHDSADGVAAAAQAFRTDRRPATAVRRRNGRARPAGFGNRVRPGDGLLSGRRSGRRGGNEHRRRSR